jgi:high affinity sulfate transporter 1
MGYAAIAGVPVQYGLYAAAMGLIAFALFTRSRRAVTLPGSSTAAVVGAAVLSVAAAGSEEAIAVAAAIAIVAGLIYVVMFIFKMGWISQFLSQSVLTGFTFGVAINVAIGQLGKITGTEVSGDNAWLKLISWIGGLSETDLTTLVVGVAALVLLFAIKIFAPKVPGALVAVVLGILVTVVFSLGDAGVALIDEVPRGLPSLALPDLELITENWALILGTAVGVVLIGLSVTTATVRNLASKYNYRIDINQELLAQGAANVSSGLFQGFFVSGSLSRSPVNDDSGASSQLSNLAQALLILLTLLVLAPLFSALPQAVLGAIIIQAVVTGMMDVAGMRRLYAVVRSEFWISMAALLGVATFGILEGVVIGIILNLGWLVALSASPPIPELGRRPGTNAYVEVEHHPEAETYPGLMILRHDESLFYVNIDTLHDRLLNARADADPPLEGVVLSMEGVNFVDIQGSDKLSAAVSAAQNLGIDFELAHLKAPVLDLLKRSGVYDQLGAEHFHDDTHSAVQAYLRLHPEVEPQASDERHEKDQPAS